MAKGGKEKTDIKTDSGDFTLESILAEYKGTAYISGDKKTPKDILNRRTMEIIGKAKTDEPDFTSDDMDDEASDPVGDIIRAYTQQEDDFSIESRARTETEGERKESTAGGNQSGKESPPAELLPDIGPEFELESLFESGPGVESHFESEPKSESEPKPENEAGSGSEFEFGSGFETVFDNTSEKKQKLTPESSVKSESDLSFDTLVYARNAEEISDDDEFSVGGEIISFEDKRDTVVRGTSKTVKDDHGYADDTDVAAGGILSLFGRKKDKTDEREEELYEDYEEEIISEPDLKDALRGFAAASNSISQRCFPAAIVTLIMIILTFAFEGGLRLPFGIGQNQMLASRVLMLSLLVVMILCADLIVRGFSSLISGAPNAETLILFSCAFSLVSGMFSSLIRDSGILPYCTVSALSLVCSAYGERRHLRAITETLKTAVISSEPYGVIAEYNSDINKSILKKVYNRTDGFYKNLVQPDISETAYRYAAPILIIAVLLFAVLAALARGHVSYFLHIVSAMFAAAAPLTVMLSFSLPFGSIVNSARKSGAAIAGWGGADDVCFSDGACVTDDDLFPPGTIAFSGDARLYNGFPPDKALRYTASIILASGSGLAGVFSEVLRTQKLTPIKAEEFAAFEGGVSALMHGERVMAGSAAFMQLLGIRIPDDSNLKNAVYTAIEGKLAAMFAIDYKPVNSVQGALIMILKRRIKLFFAMRDFNITPLMLEQKFKVSLEDVEYTQAKDSYSISNLNSSKEGRIAALLTREGLGPFAEAVTGCRLLKSTALAATIISIASAVLGVLLMLIMCWSGAFLAARPGNLMLYMLAMLVAVLVVSGYVKCRK